MSARVIRSALAALVSVLSLVVLVACSGSDGGGVQSPVPTTVPPTPTPPPPPPSSTPTPSGTRTSTPLDTATPTATPSSAPGLYRISGRLLGIASDFTITLKPTGRTTRSFAQGFTFDGVPPGQYTIDVDDFCGDFPCFADTPVAVVDRDVAVEIANDLCPPPRLSADSGPPGATIGATGRCYYFHSGRQGYVFFGEQLLGRTSNGDTLGNYGAAFQIPLDAAPGEYMIYFAAGLSPLGTSVAVPFTVIAQP